MSRARSGKTASVEAAIWVINAVVVVLATVMVIWRRPLFGSRDRYSPRGYQILGSGLLLLGLVNLPVMPPIIRLLGSVAALVIFIAAENRGRAAH